MMSVAHITECGKVRAINQDRVFSFSGKALSVYCVADGMGGHEDGEFAAEEIVCAIQQWAEVLDSYAEGCSVEQLIDGFDGCIQGVNDKLFTQYHEEGRICGSTIACLIVTQNRFLVFSSGDSRIYRLQNRRMAQLTHDDIRLDKLTSAVGVRKEFQMSLQTGCISGDDVFLVCSDGVYKNVPSRRLKRICKNARKGELYEVLGQLKKIVDLSGAPDNYSAIIVRL